MVLCEYAIPEEDEYKRLKCKLKNGGYCIYATFCNRLQRYIHIDNYQECYIMNDYNKKTIPQGANYVRFTKNGFLYVEFENGVIKVKNPFDAQVTNYVYIKRDDLGEIQLSLSPFDNDKPKRTRRKKDE